MFIRGTKVGHSTTYGWIVILVALFWDNRSCALASLEGHSHSVSQSFNNWVSAFNPSSETHNYSFCNFSCRQIRS